MAKRKQNNKALPSDTDSVNSSNSKSGWPLTGVWKHFDRATLYAHFANSCKKVSQEWQRHFNYILVNNLEDIPTDEPLSNATSSQQSELTNWYDSVRIEPSKQLIINEAITLAFIMCGISFHVINNTFFINTLKLLNPGYEVPSHEVLSGCLLDIEVAKLGNYSEQSYIAEFLASKIEIIINRIGSNKISALYTFAERMIHYANKIVKFFLKKFHRAAAVLNQKILQYHVSACLEDIQENYSEIISSAILTILRSRGFFTDMQYLSEVLFPIKNAILLVEANCSTLADCYINLMKIVAAIQSLPANEYKGFHNYCIKKFNRRFEDFNDPTYQLACFLHPAYKDIGLKFGKQSKNCEALITQLRIYKEQQKIVNGNPNPYIASYTID
ncbi:35054_t:CDS:2, partial [Gigaspora margarita]